MSKTASRKAARRRNASLLAPALAVLAIAGDVHADNAAAPASRLPEPLSIPAFIAIPRPAPTAEIAYGTADTQTIDLFVPTGSGPFPVVVLIHGGCWSTRTAAREQLRHLGADLAQRGIAVWSLGYRRANEAGGGYPGTYQDVGAAIDRLRDEALRYRLDLSRMVLVGHSAGGHLALWAAGRDRLPSSSVLRVDAPLVPKQVISVAGIGDLKRFAPLIPSICGPGVADTLVGQPSASRPDVFSDTSPAQLIAPDARIVMASGVLDRLVPPYVAHDYAEAVRGHNEVTLLNLPDAGHFDLVATGRPAWNELRRRIEAALSSTASD